MLLRMADIIMNGRLIYGLGCLAAFAVGKHAGLDLWSALLVAPFAAVFAAVPIAALALCVALLLGAAPVLQDWLHKLRDPFLRLP